MGQSRKVRFACPRSSSRALPRAVAAYAKAIAEVVIADENKAFDMKQVISALVDEGSFLELKPRFAQGT